MMVTRRGSMSGLLRRDGLASGVPLDAMAGFARKSWWFGEWRWVLVWANTCRGPPNLSILCDRFASGLPGSLSHSPAPGGHARWARAARVAAAFTASVSG